MATATQPRTTRGIYSPFAIADVDAAYVAYNNAPFAKSPTFTKPTKAQFKKMHAQRHQEAKAREDAKIAANHTTTTAPATAPEIDLTQFDSDTARIIANSLGIEYTEPEPEPDAGVDLNTLVSTLVASGADAETIAAAVVAFTNMNGTVDTSTEVYRQRTPKEDIPADAARNAVLWALNTEGFLMLVPEGGCDTITQLDGTTLLSEEFGPLVPRTA